MIAVGHLVPVSYVVELGAVDLGKPHKWAVRMEPRVCCWLNDGDAADLAKAAAWCKVQSVSEGETPWQALTADTLDNAKAQLTDGAA